MEIDIAQNKSLSVREAENLPQSRGFAGFVDMQRFFVTSIGRVGRVQNANPLRAETQLATQIFSQIWGGTQRISEEKDQWIANVIPDVLARLYIREAYGDEIFEQSMQSLRVSIEQPSGGIISWDRNDAQKRQISLTGSTVLSDIPARARLNYGLYVFGYMLRNQIGETAFWAALQEAMEATQPPTTQSLKSLWEKHAQRELDTFFDFWVRGGFIPSLSIYRFRKNEAIFVCIQSDLHFGRFDVPIQLQIEGRIIKGTVEIKAGKSAFFYHGDLRDSKVAIDPTGYILAFEREGKIKEKEGCIQDLVPFDFIERFVE